MDSTAAMSTLITERWTTTLSAPDSAAHKEHNFIFTFMKIVASLIDAVNTCTDLLTTL